MNKHSYKYILFLIYNTKFTTISPKKKRDNISDIKKKICRQALIPFRIYSWFHSRISSWNSSKIKKPNTATIALISRREKCEKNELEKEKGRVGPFKLFRRPSRRGEGRPGKKSDENKFPIEFISIKRTNPTSVLRLGKITSILPEENRSEFYYLWIFMGIFHDCMIEKRLNCSLDSILFVLSSFKCALTLYFQYKQCINLEIIQRKSLWMLSHNWICRTNAYNYVSHNTLLFFMGFIVDNIFKPFPY